jgi:hypothetical protein
VQGRRIKRGMALKVTCRGKDETDNEDSNFRLYK